MNKKERTYRLLLVPVVTWEKLMVMAGDVKTSEYARRLLIDHTINVTKPSPTETEDTIPDECPEHAAQIYKDNWKDYTHQQKEFHLKKINKSCPAETISKNTVPPEELIDPSSKEEF